jgi:hypothetical protein
MLAPECIEAPHDHIYYLLGWRYSLPAVSGNLTDSEDETMEMVPCVPFSTLFPHANLLAIDLLARKLCFDPAKYILCEHTCNHPHLRVWNDKRTAS